MLIHPRVALASGSAAAVGATLMVLGRVDGSLVIAVILAVAARAAALAASPEARAVRALGILVRTLPAWVALAVIVTLRAGSPVLADAWGANAVAGLGIARGEVATVVGLWLGALGVAVAIAAPTAGAGPLPLASRDPWRRLETLALAVQVPLLAGVVAGPQVTGALDLVPWLVGSVVVGGAVAAAGATVARPETATRAALVLAVAGLVLAIGGSGP